MNPIIHTIAGSFVTEAGTDTPVGKVDATLSRRIQKVIANYGFVRAVVTGRCVTLTGFVSHSDALLIAEQKAKELGAQRVVNKLFLAP